MVNPIFVLLNSDCVTSCPHNYVSLIIFLQIVMGSFGNGSENGLYQGCREKRSLTIRQNPKRHSASSGIYNGLTTARTVRYLSRAERPLMPVHRDARSSLLLSSDSHKEARQPVLQIVFVLLIDDDRIGCHIRNIRISLPKPRDNGFALCLKMPSPLSTPEMHE